MLPEAEHVLLWGQVDQRLLDQDDVDGDVQVATEGDKVVSLHLWQLHINGRVFVSPNLVPHWLRVIGLGRSHGRINIDLGAGLAGLQHTDHFDEDVQVSVLEVGVEVKELQHHWLFAHEVDLGPDPLEYPPGDVHFGSLDGEEAVHLSLDVDLEGSGIGVILVGVVLSGLASGDIEDC